MPGGRERGEGAGKRVTEGEGKGKGRGREGKSKGRGMYGVELEGGERKREGMMGRGGMEGVREGKWN